MKMVCFCEKVHFRFLYTPSLQKISGPINRKPKTYYYLCHQISTKTIIPL